MLDISINQYIEWVCGCSDSFSSLAVFVLSVSLTTTVLQDSDRIKEMWADFLEQKLGVFGQSQVDYLYVRDDISSDLLNDMREVTSRFIQAQVIEYKESKKIQIALTCYTKEVYVCCFIVAVLLFYSPENWLRYLYFCACLPLPHLGMMLLDHWRKIRRKIDNYISDENAIKVNARNFSSREENF